MACCTNALDEAVDEPTMMQIGKGGYGEVFLDSNKEVVKRARTEMDVVSINCEYHMLMFLKGVNFVVDVHRLTPEGIHMEFAGRDLYEHRPSDYKTRNMICSDLVSSIVHLHCLGVAHRDIKLENVCWDGTRMRLIDFGLAVHSTPHDVHKKPCGSRHYCCPEMCSVREYHPFQADAWSTGITMFALLFEHFPFSIARNDDAAFVHVSKSKLPPLDTLASLYPSTCVVSNVSNDNVYFLNLCLQGDPRFRTYLSII